MAHIPRQEIERLQQEISLQCLVEAQGIELQRQGVEFLGSCPFHSDSELSLVVCPQSNEWRCRACQTGGSVIDWVRKCRGVSFRHAVEMLRNDHPALAAAAPVVSKGTASAVKLEMPFTPGSEDRQLLRQVSDHYHETLKESPEALKYLSGRGLQHPDMLAHFRLGFANRTLGYRLPGPPAVPVEKPRPLSIPEPVPVPAPAPHLSSACGIDIPAEINGDEITIPQGDRRYRIRGLARNTSHDALRVNVLVTRADAVHVDTINLYTSQQRALFSKQAADELKVDESLIKRDLGRLLLKLEELRDEQIRKALEPPEAVPLTPEETAAAMELLTDPRLLDRIVEDFDRCGVVGEQTNKLVGYIAAVSRRLEAPLAVVVQSSSAAGKSSLMEGVLAFIPEEDRVQYSAMTGQSLFYMGETDLKHKLLALVEEEGVSRAAYALKLLQSEGALTIASTGKDPGTGKLVTRQYRVEGPVMIFLTTTAIHLDEELLSRCLVLSVNEERPQTQAIHRLQREQQTLEGLLQKRERQEILCVHRNAQRLLRPLLVVNPYARDLTFLDHQTRTRRDHVKYLTLIRSIALLHQHQRPLQQTLDRGKPVQYIEVTLSDIATANRLVHEVLGRELDELPPQTRRLLLLIDQMTAGQCQQLKRERRDFRFTRRDVRSYTGWRDTQLRVHLQRLQDLEYLLVHRGGRGQSFVYELIFERGMQDDKPSLAGLIDPEKLARQVYDENKAESKGQFAEPMRGQNGGAAGSAPITPHSITTGLSNGLPVISAELPVFPGGHDKANVTTAMGDR